MDHGKPRCPNTGDRISFCKALYVTPFVGGVWLSIHLLGFRVRVILEDFLTCENDFGGQRSGMCVLEKVSDHKETFQSIKSVDRGSAYSIR